MRVHILKLILKRKPFCRLFLCILFPYFLPESSAEEPCSENPVYLMEEIVVTEKARTSVSEVTVGDEWIKMQRSGSVAEVLAGIPGASITVGTKNSSEIMIRGFKSRDVLIMVDGRPVNESYYGKIDLSTIGVGNISKIKVVKGPSSVRFGPNSMGGVINILTGNVDEGPPVDLRLTTGSGKEIRYDLIHRGHIKGLGYRIHVGRNVSNGFPLSADFEPTSLENGNLRDNSDSRRTDIGMKLLFGCRGNHPWSLSIGGTHMTKGLPSSVSESRFWRYRNWNRTSIDLDGVPVKRDFFRLKTKFYAERFLNELVDYRDQSYNPSNVFFESTHDNRSAGILVSSAYFPKDGGLTNFGLQVRLDESRRQAAKGLDWFLNRTATTWVFAEYERSFNKNLLLRGGISGHLFSYDSWERSSTSLDPSIYLEWALRDYTVTGAVCRVSRFPTLHQLFSRTSGNPDLEPEWALKGEVTISRSLTSIVNLSFAGFMSTVHDMIYRSGRLGFYHNIEKAALNGVEFTGELKLSQFKIFSALSLLDARDSEGEELVYRPSWKVDSGLSCRIYYGIRLHVTSRFVGRRRSEANSYLEKYHVEDIGIVAGEGRTVSLSINFKNIFDVNYEEELGYPLAGRTLWAGVDGHWDGW